MKPITSTDIFSNIRFMRKYKLLSDNYNSPLWVYLSHPYSGNENDNRNEVKEVAAKLCKQFPDYVFINPLNAMEHEAIAKLEYEVSLSHTIELLMRCDCIIMLGEWRNSKGCMREYEYAQNHYIDIYENVENFERELK